MKHTSKPGKNSAAIVAMVLGSLAVAFSPVIVLNNFGFMLGIMGLVWGTVGLASERRVMSTVALALCVLGCVITMAMQLHWDQEFQKLEDSLNQPYVEVTP